MEVHYRGSGKVKYNDSDYQCHLYFSEDQGGIVIKICNITKFIGSFLELPIEIEYLYGQLDNGFNFVLYRSKRTDTPSHIFANKTINEYVYESQKIICGLTPIFKNNFLFSKASYKISNIIDWAGLSTFSVDENMALISKEEIPEKLVYQNNEYSIFYKVAGSMLPFVTQDLLREKIELTQNGYIEILSNNEQKIGFFDDIFEKLRRIIEISTLTKINVEGMNLYTNEITETYGDQKINIPLHVYGTDIKKYEESENKSSLRRYAWISLTELIENNAFELYFEKYAQLEPIIELYLEPFYYTYSYRRVFLNLVQALETYHSRFVTNDINQYKARVNSLTSDNTLIDFLLPYKNKIALQSRIADLLLAEFQIIFDTGDFTRNDFPEIIAITRNYYIHYDENKLKTGKVLSEEDLGIYNRVLVYMLEYYILKELGFDSDILALQKKLSNR
ncbi:MAG: hypothetical protein IJI14_15630 [Anaerolineaceae bacterium]|nr:hypothetical protein [Anaerolineaceae bacterium]